MKPKERQIFLSVIIWNSIAKLAIEQIRNMRIVKNPEGLYFFMFPIISPILNMRVHSL
jgi:hypothetical protein